MRIAVFGGGNGAFATAGDLTLRGHDVVMCELPAFVGSIAPLTKIQAIDVEALPTTGLPSGRAVLAGVTTDARLALGHAQIVLLVVPSFAHRTFAEFLAPGLQSGHAVLIAPGNLWGAVRFERWIRQAGAPPGVLVGEAECMAYATRKSSASAVTIRGFKQHLGVAALDPARSHELLERLKPLYPTHRSLDNVLQTGLGNVNPFFHPPILLTNLGRVSGDLPWRLYVDGVSRAVAELIEALDRERLSAARALEIPLATLRELIVMWYGHEGAAGDDLHAAIHSVPGYQRSMAPTSLQNTRYLFEDIPFGLAQLTRLAAHLGIATPITTALVALARTVVGGRAAELDPPKDPEPEEALRVLKEAAV